MRFITSCLSRALKALSWTEKLVSKCIHHDPPRRQSDAFVSLSSLLAAGSYSQLVTTHRQWQGVEERQVLPSFSLPCQNKGSVMSSWGPAEMMSKMLRDLESLCLLGLLAHLHNGRDRTCLAFLVELAEKG